MTTSFTSLPIIDLAPLTTHCATEEELRTLSTKLYDVFATVGFAYLINIPLSYTHDDVFGLAKEFFNLPEEVKMGVAKKTFRPANRNTYRGYFPAQPSVNAQNLKAGFEIGPSHRNPASSKPSTSPFNLTEANCFPDEFVFPSRDKLETLYAELNSLANTLLALLASSLGKNAASFTSIMRNSVSTLRMLHYPLAESFPDHYSQSSADRNTKQSSEETPELTCTPHTDSGLLTLLHQDSTGGLEVLNAKGNWIPAPYVPNSIVINVGDLMAQISDGRFVATQHRVRSVGAERYSVPFFCEPGVEAMVGERGKEVRYEEFVLEKMGMWVEFQDAMEEEERTSLASNVSGVISAF